MCCINNIGWVTLNWTEKISESKIIRIKEKEIRMAAKKRKRRNYTSTFKKQIVQLYQNGKSKSDIAKEYDVHISVIGRWLSQYDNSGSFKEKENRSELELENIQLKKRNKELEMENDILKQAALILGRK